MTYNVLFPSGRVLQFTVLSCAEMYVRAYGATLLPNNVLDKESTVEYNGSVLIKEN